MPRARGGFKSRRRRNKIFKLAKGFHFDRRTKFRHAATTVVKALHQAFEGRRLFKRDRRSLWIIRINAAVRTLGSNYSGFMNALKNKNVLLNRKMLSEMAIRDFDGFKALYNASKK
ncbi:MAG: 50S ribosomal protein L20 [Bacteriovoracaceae bacterium]|nr:50S ribosomal protein L20 [Bacteriovoracaceae bacterium]